MPEMGLEAKHACSAFSSFNADQLLQTSHIIHLLTYNAAMS
jgi:hypothetical protein